METINRELKDYIEQQILPIYKNNDSGHGIEHIQYVVKRSLRFASQFPNINLDMVYAIASFHDIAHHIDKDNHEVLSAKLFYENEKMKDFFDDKQRKIIKEAIEDHRASLEHEPRSDYGKIISSADRTTSIDSVLQRTHSYTTKHYPDLDLFQMVERSYNHMLKKYGGNGYAKNYCYDEAVVAAGYLHDVVEDTKYTIEDIKKEFGDEVANLVMGASEPDKSLSWEERKAHTIEETKKLPLKNKLVICADKINNLEDLMLKFQKSGKRDFSAFKRGEEQQKWYYTSVYESLIYGEDENLPIFKRLKNVLDIVFAEKEDLYLRDTIFDDNREYYEKLKKLHAQKVELQKLKALCALSKPFVIEFSGTPRTGKTTTINNLYDFFKKGGFKVAIVEEFTTSKYYKEQIKDELDKMNLGDSNIAIIEYVYKQLLEALENGQEIIFIDRSLNDRQIWNYRRYVRGDMPEEQYFENREKYSALSRQLIDFLVITYADSLTSLKRDYNSSLALEKRNFLNIANLDEYNRCLKDLKELFETSVEDLILLDTTSMDMNDVSVEIASQIMPAMRKRYIKSFKQKYNLK